MPEQLEIPPRGSRGAGTFFMRLLQPFGASQVSRYRKNAGPEQPKMMGMPTVVLTTIGAKTGKERAHVLGGFADGGGWIVVASNAGAPTHPAWYINLAKAPEKVWLEAGNRKLKVRPVLLKGAERDAAYAKVVAVSPRYGEYPKKTDREIPVLRLVPDAG